jgi:hypothetical protein
MTVLNGGEGVNRMLGGILAQVGDYLPALASALKTRPPQATTIQAFRFVGSGRSPRPSGRPVSERHDAALAEAFAAPRRRR